MPMIEGCHVAVERTMRASTTSTLGDGILNVNKARGWTSHDVVAKLRGLLGVPRVDLVIRANVIPELKDIIYGEAIQVFDAAEMEVSPSAHQ